MQRHQRLGGPEHRCRHRLYAFLELTNFLAYRSVDEIAELFVREFTAGIDDTGVKAGS